MVHVLGAGTLGKVWHVTRKCTQHAYAFKVQVKEQLIEYNQVYLVSMSRYANTKLPWHARVVAPFSWDVSSLSSLQ